MPDLEADRSSKSASVDKLVARLRKFKIVIADVLDQEATKPKWRGFASERLWKNFVQAARLSPAIAFSWKRSGRTVAQF